MTVYSFISSLLSYVFTVIIYLFIFSVICLIYMDIKKMNKGDNAEDNYYDDSNDEHTALLCTIKSEEAVKCKMKKRYRIGEDATVVGRGKECDIRVDNMFLSLEHFQIWYEDGVWYIGDIGSKNGTMLNGTKLKKVKPLKDGDIIFFGGIEFTFKEE